jgi:phosphohistidine phosphatase SixA
MKPHHASTLIVLVRHAERDFVRSRPDWQQPLTQRGQKTAGSLGAKLYWMLNPAGDSSEEHLTRIIFSSPYLRAWHTARLIGGYLHPKAGVREAELLAPGSEGTLRWVLETVSLNLGSGPLVFVGHKPDLAEIAAALCQNCRLELDEGEAACFELVESNNGFWQIGSGHLLWRIKG